MCVSSNWGFSFSAPVYGAVSVVLCSIVDYKEKRERKKKKRSFRFSIFKHSPFMER